MARVIRVDITGSSTSLRRALRSASHETSTFERNIGKSARGAIAGSGAFRHLGRSIAFASASFIGAAGLTEAFKVSVEGAIELQREMRKTNVVFGQSSGEVEQWARTSATAFGLSEHHALKVVNAFGQMFQVMGVTRKRALVMSEAFAKLAPKLALFAGKSPEEASAALTQAIAGRTRGLKQFGIVIDQVTVKAEAMRLGLIKSSVDSRKVEEAQVRLNIALARAAEAHRKYGAGSTQAAAADNAVRIAHDALGRAVKGTSEKISQAAKATATYSLVQQQAKNANELWRRSQGSVEVQMRRLHASIQNIQVEIGTAFLPIITKLSKRLADWLSNTKNQKLVMDDFNQVMRVSKDVLSAVWAIAKVLKDAFDKLASAVGGTRRAFELLLALGIAAKLRVIAISLGLTGGGIAGGARAATLMVGKLRLALATLYSTALLGGLGRTLGVLSAIGAAIGVIATVDVASRAASKVFGGPVSGSKYNTIKIHLPNGKVVEMVNVGSLPATMNYGGKLYFRKGNSNNYYTDVASTAAAGAAGAAAGSAAQTGAGAAGGAAGGQRPVQLPTTFRATHDTSGIAGYQPSVDITVHKGQPVLAPENGQLYNRHMIPYRNLGTAKAVGGWTVYYHGFETGQRYFITHLGAAGPNGIYRRGQQIGVGGRTVNAPHVHVGILSGAGATTSLAGMTGGDGGGTGGLTVGKAASAATWKGATQSTIISAKASVTALIKEASQSIGGIAGPMDAVERQAIAKLKALREHLKIHMSSADLAATKASIAKWGKVLKDEISVQTKKAQRAFDQASKQLLRNFDRETQRGLAALAAPAETPAEKALRELQDAHDAADLQRALAEAMASGDAQAIADAQYNIQVAALQKQAAAEREQADKDAEQRQQDYQDARDDQRQALEDQLDDWKEWLTNKKRTWNEFWAWIKANPQGGPISTPNIGETASAPGFGGRRGPNIGEPWTGAKTPGGAPGSRTGGETNIHFHGGTFIGGNPDQVARDLAGPMRSALYQARNRVGSLQFE